MGKIRVLAVVGAEETLRDSASNFSMGVATRLDKAPAALPAMMDLDADFAAVPLASRGATGLASAMTPDRAPQFVVRGTVDEKRFAAMAKDGVAEVDGARLFADPVIAGFASVPGCGTGPVGSAADVATMLDVPTLKSKRLNGSGVAVAIMDNGINLAHLRSKGLNPAFDASVSWSPGHGSPGSYPVDHGTMCAYDALIAAPKATLLDFPILLSNTPGGSLMEGFLSDALQAYSVLLTLMRGPANRRPFRSLVVNNSWGMYHQSWDFPAGHPGRYADNMNHPFNIVVGALGRSGVDILFAAGNCGSDCPDRRCKGVVTNTIMGANAHPQVLTIAGATVQDRRVGYSSQGPGIAGMAHAKPDLTSYTHFLGSEAFGQGTEDGGTSAACPVAAGAVAAIRTRLPASRLSPGDLARELRIDARKRGGGASGWNRNYGYGVIRPALTATRFGL
jgi:subtilisin family serine protease